MGRLKQKTLDELTPEQREAFDKVVSDRPVKPRGGHIGGPFDAWVSSPEMGQRLVGLGGFFRFRTSVDRRYVELAILVTGQFWQAQFEWFAHEPMAREAGVPEPIIAALKVGATPPLTDEGDKAVYALAHEIHHNKALSEATYASAVVQFGEVGVAELLGLCGFYGLVSMTLNGFDVDLPEGAQPPFPA